MVRVKVNGKRLLFVKGRAANCIDRTCTCFRIVTENDVHFTYHSQICGLSMLLLYLTPAKEHLRVKNRYMIKLLNLDNVHTAVITFHYQPTKQFPSHLLNYQKTFVSHQH